MFAIFDFHPLVIFYPAAKTGLLRNSLKKILDLHNNNYSTLIYGKSNIRS